MSGRRGARRKVPAAGSVAKRTRPRLSLIFPPCESPEAVQSPRFPCNPTATMKTRTLLFVIPCLALTLRLTAAEPAAAPALKPNTTEPMGQAFREPKPADTLRVLLVGAGGSHDFPRFFLGADSVILKESGGIDTAATPNLAESMALLPQADVLVFSANHGQFGKPEFQQKLNEFADAGKGIVVLHAGVWHNWPPATNFNKRFVGGGAKSHGKGEFEVKLKPVEHPVTRGIAASFRIIDESYHVILEPGAAVEVLAEIPAEKGRPAYPAVWTVKDPKTRIACISLGHAEEAHSNSAYKSLLVNAVRWVAGK